MVSSGFFKSLPLMQISGFAGAPDSVKSVLPGLKRISNIKVKVDGELPASCFIVELPDKVREMLEHSPRFGVLGPADSRPALENVYLLGERGKTAAFCRLVKKDASSGTPRLTVRPRKSFMTPTPLHIPESRVSPIPESTHEMIYVQKIGSSESLKVIPVREVAWMYPLIHVMDSV